MISIGLDLGRSHARAVALSIRERKHDAPELRVLAHAEAARSLGDGERPLAAVVDELVDRLGRHAKGDWTVVCADLPLVVKVIPVPGLDPARVRRLLRLELEGLANALAGEGPRTDLAADAVPLPASDGDPLHLALATDAQAAGTLLKELKRGGIADPRLGVPAAALGNLPLIRPALTEGGPVLVVDIGRESSSVALIGPAGLIGCRAVALGGQTFTEALAGADPSPAALVQAEQRKCAGDGHESPWAQVAKPVKSAPGSSAPARMPPPATVSAPVPPAASTLSLDDDELSLDMPAALAAPAAPVAVKEPENLDLSFDDLPAAAASESPVTDPLLAPPGSQTMAVGVRVLGPELARAAEALYLQVATTLTWIRAQSRLSAATPVRILLTGGGSQLHGLPAYLERRFSIPVITFDPSADLPDWQAGAGGPWAVALGSALAPVVGAVAPDLTPDEIQKAQAWRRELLWPYIAAGILGIAGIFLAWDLYSRASAAEADILAMKNFAGGANKELRKLEALEQQYPLMSEDLRAIAGRIYAGRDLLDVLQAAKKQAEIAHELWLTDLRTIPPDPSMVPAAEPVSGGRFGTSAKPAGRADATVDRGGVEFRGYVKFTSARTYDQLVKFFDAYYQAMREASSITGEPLFDLQKSRVEGIEVQREKADAGGKVPFRFRLWFRPTSLEPVGAAQPEATP